MRVWRVVSASTLGDERRQQPAHALEPSGLARWALRLEVKAERVPVRVEVDADILLRLEVS